MSFDNNYPNRKDHRKPYRKSAAFDRHCRPHGNCPYCEKGRLHVHEHRQPLVEIVAHTDRYLTKEQMAEALDKISKPSPPSVPLKYTIDYTKVI